ncbi:MAG: DNA repair protein RecN, partial [Clostridia bacterium]|nr:DNA repair protein RecN [Clostridia bacterium]
GSQTVIYDEIDAGVSGRTARKIGIKLKESARDTQVICVTHSAQIASLADVHYKITKEQTDAGLESNIRVLDREGRVEELSRILGGINVTQAQRQAALDMLEGDN